MSCLVLIPPPAFLASIVHLRQSELSTVCQHWARPADIAIHCKAQPLPHGGSTLSAKADIKKVMATVVSSLKGEFAVLLEGLVEGPNLG